MIPSSDSERERKRNAKNNKMGIANRHLLVALAVAFLFGTAVYFRLWVIDNKISSIDAELLRRQFDLANKEAVDESAEWRYRFDEEREKTNKCMKELSEIKQNLGNTNDTPTIHERFRTLHKEKKDLLEKVEFLQQQLETERSKCNKSQ